MTSTLRISRQQLAKFLGNDHDAIRQFETLFNTVATPTTATATEPEIQIETAGNEALARIERLERAFQMLELAPASRNHAISEITGLQSALDEKDVYSTTETLTTKTWLGSAVYRKVVYLGYLTNATQASVASGLSNVTIVSITGIMRQDNSTIATTIPFYHPDSGAGVGIWIDTNYAIATKPAGNRTTCRAWAIIEYVKN